VQPVPKGPWRTNLNGYQEVPSVFTTGTGTFQARLIDPGSIEYRLDYSGLEGTDTLFAHIHFGQTSVNGGVAAFLCGGGDKPACTDTSGSFTGIIDASDVVGPAGQGIAAGELNELIAALRSGNCYANLHTNKHPGGEIRGQIVGGGM
jgi:hypothetical protein